MNRVLTHYELKILIKNEINNMQIDAVERVGPNIYYAKERALDILKYVEEYNSLEKESLEDERNNTCNPLKKELHSH